jgi:hypothetical protein
MVGHPESKFHSCRGTALCLIRRTFMAVEKVNHSYYIDQHTVVNLL